MIMTSGAPHANQKKELRKHFYELIFPLIKDSELTEIPHLYGYDGSQIFIQSLDNKLIIIEGEKKTIIHSSGKSFFTENFRNKNRFVHIRDEHPNSLTTEGFDGVNETKLTFIENETTYNTPRDHFLKNSTSSMERYLFKIDQIRSFFSQGNIHEYRMQIFDEALSYLKSLNPNKMIEDGFWSQEAFSPENYHSPRIWSPLAVSVNSLYRFYVNHGSNIYFQIHDNKSPNVVVIINIQHANSITVQIHYRSSAANNITFDICRRETDIDIIHRTEEKNYSDKTPIKLAWDFLSLFYDIRRSPHSYLLPDSNNTPYFVDHFDKKHSIPWTRIEQHAEEFNPGNTTGPFTSPFDWMG